MPKKIINYEGGMFTIEATIVFSAVLLCVSALFWMSTMMFRAVSVKAEAIKAQTSDVAQIKPATLIHTVDFAIETFLKQGQRR